MNRTEFLETLRAQLSGQMQEGKAAAHVRYYRDYMEDEMRKGRSEAEVLEELGDPRLIARTLLDTDPDAGQQMYENSSGYGGQSYDGAGSSDYNGRPQREIKQRRYKLDLTAWYGKVIVIAVAAAIIAGLVALIGVMMPVIIVVCLVMLFISWFRRR